MGFIRESVEFWRQILFEGHRWFGYFFIAYVLLMLLILVLVVFDVQPPAIDWEHYEYVP